MAATPDHATALVVDASVLCSILLLEDRADEAAERLGRRRLFAPPVLPFEVMNAMCRSMRRSLRDHGDTAQRRDAFAAAVSRYDAFRVELVDVAQARILRRALQHDLSVYDASYLELATWLDLELVTFDDRLRAAYDASRSR